MTRKIGGIVLAVCMLLACCVPAVQATVRPSEPEDSSSAWIFNQGFEGVSTGTVYTTRGDGVLGRVLEVSGNNVVSLYHYLLDDAVTLAPKWYAPFKTFETPIASGFFAYKAQLMVPNVAAEGEEPKGGAHPCVGLWGDTEAASNQYIAAGITANEGVNNGTFFTWINDRKYTMDCDIQIGQWYELMMIADPSNNRADIYLNGRLMVMELPFFNTPTAGVKRIGAMPEPNSGTTTVAVGDLLGDGTRATASRLTFKGNPYPGYVDNVKVYTISESDAVDYTKAGLEEIFNNSVQNGDIALPFATSGTNKTFHYASANSAVRLLNTNAALSQPVEIGLGHTCNDPNDRLIARVTPPVFGGGAATGDITVTFTKGTTAVTHTIPMSIAGTEYRMSATPAEVAEGILGYYVYDDFEGYAENATAIENASTYALDIHTVQSVDGNKCLKVGTTNYISGMAFTFGGDISEGYLVMRADVMIPENVTAYPMLALCNRAVADNTNAQAGLVNRMDIGKANSTLTATVSTSSAHDTMIGVNISNLAINNAAWHTYEIVQDVAKGQWDIFLDGVPILLDAYNGKDGEYTNTLRSVLLGAYARGTADNAAYFDNLSVAKVTGEYVREKFKDGFAACLANQMTTVDETSYIKDTVHFPRNSWVSAADANFVYSTANTALSIWQRTDDTNADGNPAADIRANVTRSNADVSGNIQVAFNKGGASDVYTQSVTVLRNMFVSLTDANISVSALPIVGTIAPGETVTVSGLYDNKGANSPKVDIILAAYGDQYMYKIAIETVVFSAGTSDGFSTSFVLPNNLPTGAYIKAFLWENGTMQPLI